MSDTHATVVVETCAKCNGEGKKYSFDPAAGTEVGTECDTCKGLGNVFVEKTYVLVESNDKEAPSLTPFSVSKFPKK